MKRIYLDNSATTKMSPNVIKAIIKSFDLAGNPSSLHQAGQEARYNIELARKNVASLIGASPSEIIFTSGATESNNTVINIARQLIKQSHNQLSLIVSSIEHPSIIEPARQLKKDGVNVYYLPVDHQGQIDISALETILKNQPTALVSIMLANNETGTIQNVKLIAELVHKNHALLHTDIVQAVGKIPINVHELNVDYATLSAHKLDGPKGVGAFYIKEKSPYFPFMLGGHQENGLRATTYNTQGIIGFGQAAKDAVSTINDYTTKVKPLRDYLKDQIIKQIPDVSVNGNQISCLPNILNVSFAGAEGESILLALDNHGIEVSTGSACASGDTKPSHVLMAIKADPELAHGSIRFSLNPEITLDDINYVMKFLPAIINDLRKISTISSKGEKIW